MGYFKNTTVWGDIMPPLVTLVFLKVEGQNLVTWGILMCFLKKWHQFSNSGFLWHHYDVIRGNIEGLVTVVFQGRTTKFGKLGYFDVYFSKNYLFSKFKASFTSL